MQQSAWHNDQAPEELWPPWRLHQSLGSIFRRPAGPCTSCHHLFAQRPHLHISPTGIIHDTTVREIRERIVTSATVWRVLPSPAKETCLQPMLASMLDECFRTHLVRHDAAATCSVTFCSVLWVQCKWCAACACARAAWLLSSQFLRDLGRRTGTCAATAPFMR